ncbi:MAG TPA: nitroreductase, partial [Clostridiaceae bacterium]|nr:nitroreductase [Clostridiaceae bacterium]
MELLEVLQKRRSIRKYTGEPIPDEKLTAIIQAGLLSASSRSFRPWELIVIKDRETLEKLSLSRKNAAFMLENSDVAIVVIGDTELSTTWIEDCSVVLSNMHLMADSLGIGSCWVQGRVRNSRDGRTTDECVRELLGYPEKYQL